MQNFKTSKSHIIVQGLLLCSLVILTFINKSNNSLHLPIMLIVDVIVLTFFISSLMRQVTITENEVIVKHYFKVSKVDLNKITYADSISAIARWVIILSSDKGSVIISSLVDDFDKIVNLLNAKLPEDEKDKLSKLNKNNIDEKKRGYNFLMIVLTCIVFAAIIKVIVK